MIKDKCGARGGYYSWQRASFLWESKKRIVRWFSEFSETGTSFDKIRRKTGIS